MDFQLVILALVNLSVYFDAAVDISELKTGQFT